MQTLKQAVTEARKRIVLEHLRASEGNVAQAAKTLGVCRTRAYTLIIELELKGEIYGTVQD